MRSSPLCPTPTRGCHKGPQVAPSPQSARAAIRVAALPSSWLLHVCCTRRARGGLEGLLHLMKWLLIGYRRRDSNPRLHSPAAKSVAKCALTSTNGAARLPETCTNAYRSGPKRPEMLHVCCTERWPDGAQTTLRSHLLASRQRALLTDVLTHGKTGRLGEFSVSDPGCGRARQARLALFTRHFAVVQVTRECGSQHTPSC